MIDEKSGSIGENNYPFISNQEDISMQDAYFNVRKRFDFLFQQFIKAGRMRSKDNDNLIVLYFHAIMGAYLKNCVMTKPAGATDLRVPVVIIQDSGTGKSQLNKFSMDIVPLLGMNGCIETKFSGPGMIGTFDRSAHEYNVKNGLSKANASISKQGRNGNTHVLNYKDPVIKGDFATKDIIFIDEAKILFQEGRHTEGFLSEVQPILDYPGMVRKKLSAEEPIEYECNCSLVSSTVDFDSIDKNVMLQGFFPRCAVHFRSVSLEEQIAMSNKVHSEIFDKAQYNQLLQNIVNILQNNGDLSIRRDKFEVCMTQESLTLLSDMIQEFIQIARVRLYGGDIKVVRSFISRMSDLSVKISGQVAVINNKKNSNGVFVAGEDEMNYAMNVVRYLFNNLINNLDVSESKQDFKLDIYAKKIMNELHKIGMRDCPKAKYMEILSSTTMLGKMKAERLYRMLKANNYIAEKKISGVDTVYPNWKNWNKEFKTMGEC